MIVASFFEGDDDYEVAQKQHDVYGDALGVVVSTCNRHTRLARALLNDQAHPVWGTVERFDHRTLQGAHDLLAAAWRFRHDSKQLELPIKVPDPRFGLPLVESPIEPHDPLDEIHLRWLRWLREEVEGWVESPSLVRSVQLILANQNERVGDAAETQLCVDILCRFEDVPWSANLRAAYEEDLAKNQANF